MVWGWETILWFPNPLPRFLRTMYDTVFTKNQATKSVVRSTEYNTASTKKRATKSLEKAQDPSCEKEYEARGNKYQRILKVRASCAWPWPKKKTWVLTTISSSGDARTCGQNREFWVLV
jgi:hypothetical protein